MKASDLRSGMPRPPRLPLADRIEARPRFYLGLLTLWFALGNVCMNVHRPFWFDEIYTLTLGRAASISDIWPLMRWGNEPNPPLTFWIQWLVYHTIGEGEVISRLPAASGFWLMCLCLFQLVRRRAGVAYGFLAMVFPVFTFTGEYGTYARGYGWLLGSSAAAVLCWQYACDGLHRRRVLPLLTLTTAIMVSCHYYAFYVVGSIAAGELIRTKRRDTFPKGIDRGIWIALAIGMLPLALYLPLIRSAMRGQAGFWTPSHIAFIGETYNELLGGVMLVFLLWMWFAATRKPTSENSAELPPDSAAAWNWPIHEALTCLLLVAMPLVVGIAAQFLPLIFYKFYVQPSVIGMSILLALFVQRVSAGLPQMRRTAVALVFGCGVLPWGLFQMMKAATWPSPGARVLQRFAAVPDSPLPLLIDNNDRYLAVFYYAPPKLRERLFVLTDRASSLQFLGSNGALGTLDVVNAVRPIHLTPYAAFIRNHAEFLVALPNAESWMIQKLLADGFRLELQTYDKGFGPFTDEMFVFHVRAPAQALSASTR